jgi:hypothetical protein
MFTGRILLYWGFVIVVGLLAAMPLRQAAPRASLAVGGLGLLIVAAGFGVGLVSQLSISQLAPLLFTFESDPPDPFGLGRFVAVGYALLVAAIGGLVLGRYLRRPIG